MHKAHFGPLQLGTTHIRGGKEEGKEEGKEGGKETWGCCDLNWRAFELHVN